MKRFPIVLAGVALVAAGCFAAASIASGGSFARMLTGTTATTQTETNEQGGPPSGRRVALCHKTGPKKSPKFHTITVDQHAVQAHLNHGDSLGACAPKAPASPTTSTSAPSTSHGNSSGHGNSGSGNGKGHGKP